MCAISREIEQIESLVQRQSYRVFDFIRHMFQGFPKKVAHLVAMSVLTVSYVRHISGNIADRKFGSKAKLLNF